jgi:hypothetical protein
VPHYRLEQYILDQGVELDRGTMSRSVGPSCRFSGCTRAPVPSVEMTAAF